MNVSENSKKNLVNYFSCSSRQLANNYIQSSDSDIDELFKLADYIIYYCDNPLSALPPATRNSAGKCQDILSFIQSIEFLVRNCNW